MYFQVKHTTGALLETHHLVYRSRHAAHQQLHILDMAKLDSAALMRVPVPVTLSCCLCTHAAQAALKCDVASRLALWRCCNNLCKGKKAQTKGVGLRFTNAIKYNDTAASSDLPVHVS